MDTIIYKILTKTQWNDAESLGHFTGAPIDLADGFIHFSTAGQVKETAQKHFSSQTDLCLAAVNADALGDDLKYEVSRGGALFPHLYANLYVKDIMWVKNLPLDETGNHIFPELET